MMTYSDFVEAIQDATTEKELMRLRPMLLKFPDEANRAGLGAMMLQKLDLLEKEKNPPR